MVRKETQASKAIPKNYPMTEAVLTSLGQNKMQWLFLMLFVMICPLLGLFLQEFNSIYQMRLNQRPDYDWPKYSDFKIAFFAAFVLTLAMLFFQKTLSKPCACLISPSYQGEDRIERSERMIKCFFKERMHGFHLTLLCFRNVFVTIKLILHKCVAVFIYR